MFLRSLGGFLRADKMLFDKQKYRAGQLVDFLVAVSKFNAKFDQQCQNFSRFAYGIRHQTLIKCLL